MPAPVITAPAKGTSFTPGQSVTVQCTGADKISIDRIGDGLGDFASGVGNTLMFTVPLNANPSQVIQIKVSGPGGNVSQDHPISVSDPHAQCKADLAAANEKLGQWNTWYAGAPK